MAHFELSFLLTVVISHSDVGLPEGTHHTCFVDDSTSNKVIIPVCHRKNGDVMGMFSWGFGVING